MPSPNIDRAEIAKFEALASRWWDRESEFKPLHDINPLRVNWIDSYSPVAEQKLLDVGCGGGILAEAMVHRGADVTGIDMGEAPLAVAQLHGLEHVPDPLSVIAACARLVKPGGHLYFSTINRNPKAYLFAIIGAEYLLRLLPRGTHDYGKFIRPSELCQWVRECGLELQAMTGMVYNPLTRRYRMTDRDVDVNYMICVRKPT